MSSTISEITEAVEPICEGEGHDYEAQADTARRVLSELSLLGRPLLEVFNKSALVLEAGVLERAARLHPEAVFISAVTGDGLERLREEMRRAAQAGRGRARIEDLQSDRRPPAVASMPSEARRDEASPGEALHEGELPPGMGDGRSRG